MKEIDLTEIMAMDEVAIDDLVEELNEISREDQLTKYQNYDKIKLSRKGEV